MKPLIIDLIDQAAADVQRFGENDWPDVVMAAMRAASDINSVARAQTMLPRGQTRRAALLRACARLAAIGATAIDQLLLVGDEPSPRTPRERRQRRPRKRRKTV